jgi:hypothetical protein
MLRRGLALGGGLVLLILVVLGVKGCLDARANRELSDYARNVAQIVEETQQTSKAFFERLEEPGDASVTDFVDQVNADRSAVDSYQSRIDGLSAPGDMGGAQQALENVYDLRAGGMDRIADEMSTALGEVGSEKAMAVIAEQMEKLYASDVVYAALVKPEIDRVLADNGIEGDDVPKSVFVPEGTKWLDETTVSSALGLVSGTGGEAETEGIHGLGLLGTGIGGTPLESGSTTTVATEETPEVEVEVENQGDSTENGITVSVTVTGVGTLDGTIDTIGAGEIEIAKIPLTPAPKGSAEVEVNVQSVPGEELSTNNEATYSVEFE